MSAETDAIVRDARQILEVIRKRHSWNSSLSRLRKLNKKVQDPKLWDDPAHAQKIMCEREHLQTAIDKINKMKNFNQTMADNQFKMIINH